MLPVPSIVIQILMLLQADTPVERVSGPLRPGVEGRIEARIVQYTNQFRREQKLPKVRAEPRLSAAAVRYAEYLARVNKLSHTADGRDPGARAGAAGYRWLRIGENAAYTSSLGTVDDRTLGRQFLKQWKESPAHRANLVKREWRHIGVGVAKSKKSGYWYAVQMFGRPE